MGETGQARARLRQVLAVVDESIQSLSAFEKREAGIVEGQKSDVIHEGKVAR
jgi:hypothetical protein